MKNIVHCVVSNIFYQTDLDLLIIPYKTAAPYSLPKGNITRVIVLVGRIVEENHSHRCPPLWMCWIGRAIERHVN